MSLVPVVITVALLAGLVLAVRLAGERAARHAAEAGLATLNTRIAELEAMHEPVGRPQPRTRSLARSGDDEPDREWLAVLAHELRSPVGAILGYAELLDDGTAGRVDPRGRDAVVRIANAAEQILRLVEGIENYARQGDDDGGQLRDIATTHLLEHAADVMRIEAEVRNATIAVDDSEVVIRTDADVLARGLLLALGAAIKASAGREIRVSARRDGSARAIITVSGTGLGVEADDPDSTPAAMTGAGLRIILARRAIAHIGGSVSLLARGNGTDLLLTLPAAGAPGADILAAAEQDP